MEKIGLAIIFVLILLTTNLVIEASNYFQIDSFLLIRCLLAVLIFFLIKDHAKKFKKIILWGLLLLTAFFLINILLNTINVYQLNRFEYISSFCQSSEQCCRTISNIFFKFKIFRFITLSSYFFSIPILLLLFLNLYANKKIGELKINFLPHVFYLLLITILFFNIAKGVQSVYLSTIQSLQVLNENYYDRFTFKKGGTSYYGWIRVFSNFILGQTKNNSKLLLPPQSDVYKMEGNISYFRWFLYPRKLFHLGDIENLSKKQIDYLIISAGECVDKKCVWPNFVIEKEIINKIIFIDRKSQKIKQINNTNYIPENFYQSWGLIELK